MGADFGRDADETDTIGENKSLQDGRENSPTPPLVLDRDFVRFIFLPPQANFLFTPTLTWKAPRVFPPFFWYYGKHSCISRNFHSTCEMFFSFIVPFRQSISKLKPFNLILNCFVHRVVTLGKNLFSIVFLSTQVCRWVLRSSIPSRGKKQCS